MRVEVSEMVKAHPEAVWAILSDPRRLPEWYYPLETVELVDGGELHEGQRFKAGVRNRAGQLQAGAARVTKVLPLESAHWEGESRGIRATSEWTIAPRGEGCLITHVSEGSGWLHLASWLTGRAASIARRRLMSLKSLAEREQKRLDIPSERD